MDDKKYDFILFDLIGTTVQDSHNGESLILDAFRKSFLGNGFDIDYDQINLQRGKRKKEAIRFILEDNNADSELINKVYTDFIELLHGSICSFFEVDGAKNVFETLKVKKIKIGIGSGLPLAFLLRIISQVGWQTINFDYIGSSDDFGKGRPDPVMIFDAVEKTGMKDKTRILKVGDTIVDIQEGKNAGVQTAVVLTGTQTRQMLEKFNPDFIFTDINEILTIL